MPKVPQMGAFRLPLSRNTRAKTFDGARNTPFDPAGRMRAVHLAVFKSLARASQLGAAPEVLPF